VTPVALVSGYDWYIVLYSRSKRRAWKFIITPPSCHLSSWISGVDGSSGWTTALAERPKDAAVLYQKSHPRSVELESYAWKIVIPQMEEKNCLRLIVVVNTRRASCA
jgi:hypothetical protein